MPTNQNNTPDNQYDATGISIGDFMGASMLSIAKAQAAMSKEQAKAFMATCFTKKEGTYEPIMLKMVLTRSYLTGEGAIEQVNAHFNLPLLTLLPVNILGIDNVSLKFNFEVTSQFVEEKSESGKTKVNLLGGVGQADTQEDSESKMRTDRKSSTAIQVEIQAKPLPLSQGMLSLIDIYTKGIMPV
ncbi:MAG: DUF2589 domain-containing protein [Bacteroidia bacterium]